MGFAVIGTLIAQVLPAGERRHEVVGGKGPDHPFPGRRKTPRNSNFFSSLFVIFGYVIFRNSWSSNPLEFLRYLFSFKSKQCFKILSFFNSVFLS